MKHHTQLIKMGSHKLAPGLASNPDPPLRLQLGLQTWATAPSLASSSVLGLWRARDPREGVRMDRPCPPCVPIASSHHGKHGGGDGAERSVTPDISWKWLFKTSTRITSVSYFGLALTGAVLDQAGQACHLQPPPSLHFPPGGRSCPLGAWPCCLCLCCPKDSLLLGFS
jgi:hypothetical protein